MSLLQGAWADEAIDEIREGPRMVGDVVYNTMLKIGKAVTIYGYIYKGREGNSVIIELEDAIPQRVLDRVKVPINDKNQGLLKVQSFKTKDFKVLLVTVIDDFGRVKIEEYKEQ